MTSLRPAPARTLSRSLVFVMSMATGMIVANLYYLQPLLVEVRSDFHVGTIATSALLTLAQVGYALSLAFVVPLGDLFARRRLIVTIFLIAALAMAVGSLLHDFVPFALLSLVIGITSVGGQVLIPLAADLASDDERGRVVAKLMSGLLLGILLSRTFSGVTAEEIGWRGVYLVAATMLALAAFALWRTLPFEAPRAHVPYRRLLADSIRLMVDERELRRRAWLGAITFSSFSVLWSTLAFHLSTRPFHYSNVVIGLFGLLGVGGVLAANAAGHLADRQHHREASVIAALLMASSFVLLWFGRDDVWTLAVAIFALDAGAQGMHITNQTIIYRLAPEKRSRINSAYMVSCFSGASVGSLGAGLAYAHLGWAGTCTLGALIGVLVLAPALAWGAPRLTR